MDVYNVTCGEIALLIGILHPVPPYRVCAFKRRPGAEGVEVESIDRLSTRTRLPGLLYFLRFE